jgi:hypothetical protein
MMPLANPCGSTSPLRVLAPINSIFSFFSTLRCPEYWNSTSVLRFVAPNSGGREKISKVLGVRKEAKRKTCPNKNYPIVAANVNRIISVKKGRGTRPRPPSGCGSPVIQPSFIINPTFILMSEKRSAHFLLKFRRPNNAFSRTHSQGDLIGRILAHWVIVYFG